MKVQLMKVAEIRPYEANPRHNQGAIAAVKASIQQFGWRQPLVVDADKVIVVGHTRYFAALELGVDVVPVHVAKDLTPEQVKIYRIVDNRTSELSEWDEEMLRAELAAIGDVDIDLHAFAMTGGEWPLLAVPDLEDLGVDADEASGARSPLLAVGKYRIPLTEAEDKAINEAVARYAEKAGTLFGFARWLMTEAGIEVGEEVPGDQGKVTPIV